MRFVTVDNLKPGMVLARKIIDQKYFEQKSASMLEKNVKLTVTTIDRLKSSGYIGAYIIDEFSKDIDVLAPVNDETIEEGISAVASADIGSIMDIAKVMVHDISALENISVDMLDLRSYDDYTYHHSVNVAVYAVAVGVKMELPEEQIQEIAVAALCHDLGKMKISPGIINKNGRLTDEEFDEIRRHPQYSYDILYENSLVSSRVRQAVVCHHENENGSGYPFGKSEDEIPLVAKIIHAVDVYDALTSKRSYKDPYSPADALEYISGGSGILFNQEVVEVMHKVIPAYPPGIDVALSNGETAVVVSHTSQTLRPKVKLYSNRKIVDLSTDPDYVTVFITSSGILSTNSRKTVEELNESRLGIGKERRKQILVVDDSPISIGQTKSALGDDYDIVALESGLACLKYVEVKGVPDLIIMDIDMPLMDGVMTAERLKQKNYEKLNIIFLSAIANKETVVRCRRAGAVDYILKPVNLIYLKERVKIALDKKLDFDIL